MSTIFRRWEGPPKEEARRPLAGLKLTDQTGDVYDPVIWSGNRGIHSLYYNSDKPYITKIAWAGNAAPTENLTEEEMLAAAKKAKAQECGSAAEA